MSKAHKKLKERAKLLLLERGFKSQEIVEEYSFKGLKIDVVGISRTKRVAVECGIVSKAKVEFLKIHFDEVIVLPYTKETYPKPRRKRQEISESMSNSQFFNLTMNRIIDDLERARRFFGDDPRTFYSETFMLCLEDRGIFMEET